MADPKDMIEMHVDDVFKSMDNDMTCSIVELINTSITKKISTEICRAIFLTKDGKMGYISCSLSINDIRDIDWVD